MNKNQRKHGGKMNTTIFRKEVNTKIAKENVK